MKSLNFVLLLVVMNVLVALSLPGCSHRASLPISGLQSLSEDEAVGERVFMENCQRCHPQGEAGLGPSIHWAPSFAKRFQVRHGAGAMPAFDNNHLSEKELDQLISYLKARKE